MKTQQLIIIHRGDREWLCTYGTGPERAKVIELFGQPTIPTPFMIEADPLEVLREIQARNPSCTVEILNP